MSYVHNDNKMVTCPYNRIHRMKQSRLQMHIATCRLEYLDMGLKECPFHASHLINPAEYNHHLLTCECRAPLDRQLAQTINKNDPFKGRTDVPQYSDPIPVDEEWEIGTERVELPPPPVGAVLQPSEFAKPAQRRQFYLQLHQQPKTEKDATKSAIAVSPKATVVSTKPTHVPPRQPTHKSIIENTNKQNPKVNEAVGSGRGRPQPSRIAANFPRAESASVNANNMFSSVVHGMGNLGLGRRVSNNNNTVAAPIFDDDDFPALGCGRGIVSKQNVRRPNVKPKN